MKEAPSKFILIVFSLSILVSLVIVYKIINSHYELNLSPLNRAICGLIVLVLVLAPFIPSLVHR